MTLFGEPSYSISCSRPCEQGCNTRMVAVALWAVRRNHLRLQYQCRTCCGTVDGIFDLNANTLVEEVPALRGGDAVWFGCPSCGGDMDGQGSQTIVKIEVSSHFIRLHFRCDTCSASLERLFDLEAPGFVLMSGNHLQPREARRRLANWGRYRGQVKYYSEEGYIEYTAPSDLLTDVT